MGGRVLRVITRLNRGGPLRQLHGLVPALTARGWHGPVLTGEVPSGEADGTADLEDAGVEVIRVRTLNRGLDPACDGRAFKALLAAMRRHAPDVVHTHTAKAGALGRLAARVLDVPAVHTFHGHHLDAPAPRGELARFAERRLARYTAAAVALTPRQARDLVDVHRVLPREVVRVIGPALDVEAFRHRARHGVLPTRARPQVPSGATRFVWTGRFVPVKAPALLVEAVARTTKRLHVTMLGRGPLLEAVRTEIQRRGLADRMACPGSVADPAPWLAAADGLVLCSRSEGAALSVVEAQVLGLPVVTTTVGGLPDLVDHGHTGLWVPPEDPAALAAALDRLAEDEELRARLGGAAAAQASGRFDAGRVAAETAALYEEVARP